MSCAVAAGILAPALADADAAASRKHATEQAMHYLRQGVPEQALVVIRDALLLPGAASDGRFVASAVRVLQETGRLDEALDLADRCALLADVAPVRDRLRARYGRLRIEGIGQLGARMAVALDAPSVVAPDRKAEVAAIRLRASRGLPLPATLVVPAAAWSVQDRRVEVAPGASVVVEVKLPRVVVVTERDGDHAAVVDEALARLGGAVVLTSVSALAGAPQLARSVTEYAADVVLALGPGAAQWALLGLPAVPTVIARTPASLWRRAVRQSLPVTAVMDEAPWAEAGALIAAGAGGPTSEVVVLASPRREADAHAATASLAAGGLSAQIDIVPDPAHLAGAATRAGLRGATLFLLSDDRLFPGGALAGLYAEASRRGVAVWTEAVADAAWDGARTAVATDAGVGATAAGLMRRAIAGRIPGPEAPGTGCWGVRTGGGAGRAAEATEPSFGLQTTGTPRPR